MLVFASDLTVKYHCSCSLPIKLSILYEATGSGDPQRMKVTRMTKKHITIFYNHKIFCQQEIMSSWCSPTKFSSDYSWTVLRKMHYIEDDYMSTWSTQLFFLKPKVHNLGSPSSKKFPHQNNKNTVFEQCVWEHMILIIRWHIILFFFVFVLKRKEEHKLPIHWHYTWNNRKTHIDWFNPNNRNV